jgi:polyphosphate kinase 2
MATTSKTGKADADGHESYKEELYALRVELVKLQRHLIKNGEKLLLLFEGRDAAGKDGTIKRIVAYLSPRETRVVALGKPSERDNSTWYFQRWVPHLPAGEEFVCFNRSWYNRAGVERVMGFCTEIDLEEFFETVVGFEEMLIRSGIRLFKYYLDISREEQEERLADRHKNPLKQWKISPIDEVALKHWDDYSKARNEMLTRTHTPISPWTVVRADHKKTTRLNVIRDLLSRMKYTGKINRLTRPDRDVIFPFDPTYIDRGLIAK